MDFSVTEHKKFSDTALAEDPTQSSEKFLSFSCSPMSLENPGRRLVLDRPWGTQEAIQSVSPQPRAEREGLRMDVTATGPYLV